MQLGSNLVSQRLYMVLEVATSTTSSKRSGQTLQAQKVCFRIC